jgi:hypothetical protein
MLRPYNQICTSQIGACGWAWLALASLHERIHTYR